MKSLTFLLAALSIVSAIYPDHYQYVQHTNIPIIDHNGVPVDTPDVQVSKALHFAAHSAVKNGLYSAAVYTGLHHGLPVVDAKGTPIDTPEVQLAKAKHFLAYNEAAANNRNSYCTKYGIGSTGPIDTPEVQFAKASHFAAHAEANARNSIHYRKRREIGYNYPYAQHIPVIGHNGVPVDTPEVQAASAAHFAAHAKLSAQTSVQPITFPTSSHGGQNHGYPIHIPIIGKNGVPLDTPEVQAERAKHLAAHAQVSAHGVGVGGYHENQYNLPVVSPNGIPVDTPEVQHAKAAHFAAHASVNIHQHHHY